MILKIIKIFKSKFVKKNSAYAIQCKAFPLQSCFPNIYIMRYYESDK